MPPRMHVALPLPSWWRERERERERDRVCRDGWRRVPHFQNFNREALKLVTFASPISWVGKKKKKKTKQLGVNFLLVVQSVVHTLWYRRCSFVIARIFGWRFGWGRSGCNENQKGKDLRSCGDGGMFMGIYFWAPLMELMIVVEYEKNIYLCGTLLRFLVTY